MVKNIRALGKVKLVQIQPSGLIIETPSGDFYDVSRRVEVDKLNITSLGIEATTSSGEHVLDIHHIDHPDKAYDVDDLVCIGFTSHYEAMRARYGEHIVDGTAGENILSNMAGKYGWKILASKLRLRMLRQDTICC